MLRRFVSQMARKGAYPLPWPVEVLVVAALGAAASVLLLGWYSSADGQVGPGRVEVHAEWGGGGRTDLRLPPLGRVSADTHSAPVMIVAEVKEIDPSSVQQLVADGDPLESLERSVSADLGPVFAVFAKRAVILAFAVGAVAGVLIPRRRWWHALASGFGGAAGVMVLLGWAWAGFDQSRFSEPEFAGPIENAPDVLANVQRHVDDFSVIQGRAGALSAQVSRLYAAALRPVEPSGDTVDILHVSDVHLNPLGLEVALSLAESFGVDAIFDTGDLTSFGYPVESRIVDLVDTSPVPYYLIGGNHDSFEVRALLAGNPAVTYVESEVVDIAGVRVLGIPDPVFTADNAVSTAEAAELKRDDGHEVASLVRRFRPDVLAVHDPVQAEEAAGHVPLVIAGHLHRRVLESRGDTLLSVVGSTGATGLGSFTVQTNQPYEAQILRFADGRLVAIDYVYMMGVNGDFRIDRQLFDTDASDVRYRSPQVPRVR